MSQPIYNEIVQQLHIIVTIERVTAYLIFVFLICWFIRHSRPTKK
jgi:hypothetical protein